MLLASGAHGTEGASWRGWRVEGRTARGRASGCDRWRRAAVEICRHHGWPTVAANRARVAALPRRGPEHDPRRQAARPRGAPWAQPPRVWAPAASLVPAIASAPGAAAAPLALRLLGLGRHVHVVVDVDGRRRVWWSKAGRLFVRGLRRELQLAARATSTARSTELPARRHVL